MLQIDSQNALDGTLRLDEIDAMTEQLDQLYLQRCDHGKNMARFYALSITPTLFGDACLTRRWGRIGSKGQEKQHHFERREDALHLFDALKKKKRRKGYL